MDSLRLITRRRSIEQVHENIQYGAEVPHLWFNSLLKQCAGLGIAQKASFSTPHMCCGTCNQINSMAAPKAGIRNY